VPDLLWQSAPDGSTDWFNDRWYEYTGQRVEQAVGWDWLNAIHPEDRENTRADYTWALGHGEPLRLEFRLRGAHGGYRWFLAHAEPLRAASGTIVRWFGAATDIHEPRKARVELEQRVADATAELRALSQRLLVVQEEERRHLARELHDEIGQVLTGLSLNLRPGMVIDDRRLEEARRIVHDLTNQVRQLSMDLRPSALDTHGLLPALVWHIERYQERTGVRVDLRHEGMDRRFPPAVEITAYRIVQEALTNVARHAGVRDATVQLLATDGTLVVSVRDRGRGIDTSASSDTGGLGGMRERVRLVGGTLSIDTAPGEGTVVTADLPVDDNGSPGTYGAER
jgi:PAS domain S-box-containing protein